MSNRAYLSASNADTIYPSFAQKKYNALEQLIATNVEALELHAGAGSGPSWVDGLRAGDAVGERGCELRLGVHPGERGR